MNRRTFVRNLTATTVTTTAALVSSNRLLAADAPGAMWVYIGCYTGPKSKGIHAFRLDMKTGELVAKGLVAETVSPSFLALHPNGRLLYAANEVGNFAGTKGGGVSAFSVDPATGGLKFLNSQPTGGGGTCHLVVDKTGRNVLAANYGGGSVVVFPVDGQGRLKERATFIQHEGSSVDPRRQKGPHAHSINVSPDNHVAVVADLGLDKVMIYRFDSRKGKLTTNARAFATTKPGGGPRHFAFHPNGRFAYTNLEMASSVTAFAYDAKEGALEEVQTVSTLPAGFDGNNSTAETQVHPSGEFLYCSNRGHNSIAVFAINAKSGRLTHVGNTSTGGEIPRNFGIDPTGKFLIAANQKTDNLVVFRIDPKTGELKPTGHSAETPTPVCVKFLPGVG